MLISDVCCLFYWIMVGCRGALGLDLGFRFGFPGDGFRDYGYGFRVLGFGLGVQTARFSV